MRGAVIPTTLSLRRGYTVPTLRGLIKSLFWVLVGLYFFIMAQLINYGNEMIRINTQKNTIEYSTSKGSSWSTRYSGSSCGIFHDLLAYGNEILACTSKGVYYSTSKGCSWSSRYTSSSCGTFMSLADGGNQLLATTSKGLYYSTSKGCSWSKK